MPHEPAPARPMTQEELRVEAYKYRGEMTSKQPGNYASGELNTSTYYDPISQLKQLQLETINHALKLHRIIGNMPVNTPAPVINPHQVIDHKLNELVLLLQGRASILPFTAYYI